MTTFSIEDVIYNAINIYAPNLEKQIEQIAFWKSIKTLLDETRGTQVSLGGDLNIFLCEKLDKSPQVNKVYRSIETFKAYMDEYSIIDV